MEFVSGVILFIIVCIIIVPVLIGIYAVLMFFALVAALVYRLFTEE